jgi:hypothetical protein
MLDNFNIYTWFIAIIPNSDAVSIGFAPLAVVAHSSQYECWEEEIGRSWSWASPMMFSVHNHHRVVRLGEILNVISINHWKPSVKIPIAKQYRLAVMCTEDMWSESLPIHLMLKVVFVFAERWIFDWYAGSIIICGKAFNIRRSIHDGNPGGQWYVPGSRIRAGNDKFRIPQYWIDVWSRDPQQLSRCIGSRRDFYGEHIFESSKSIHEVANCVRFIFCLIKYPLCLVCKLFWKTEIFIRSRPTPFSKSHIFQIFPW